jgi:carboxyl-terminal processing protease
MMKNKRNAAVLKVTLSVLLLLHASAYIGCEAEDSPSGDRALYEQIELFSNAMTIVQSEYVEEVEPKKLVYGALEGLLSSLDSYSQFMDPDSFKEMEIDTRGEFGGLGIEIGIRDGVLTIIAPIDGTPAEKAGLKAGDKIVKIDGGLTRGLKLTEAVKKLRGKPGTKVALTVLREGEGKLLDFTITRNIIKIKSVKLAKVLTDDIGYIRLVEFQENTPRELVTQLSGLKKEGMKALILDLRNNPGGLLDVSYKVADKFLPPGKTVVLLKGRIPEQNKEYKSSGKKSFTDFPMVVLVNEGSASASEIVAGAIQDNKRGIILGTKTFGKGSVQTVLPLKDGSAVRLTTAAYYTPAGRIIKDKGIVPDLEVKLKAESEKPEKKKDVFDKVEKKKDVKDEGPALDNQLQAGIDVLRGILFDRSRSG